MGPMDFAAAALRSWGCPGAHALPTPGCSQHSTGGQHGLGPAGLSVALFPAPLLSALSLVPPRARVYLQSG